MTNSLLHVGDWSLHKMDACALLVCVGTVDPPISQTTSFLSYISLESYHLDLILIKQPGL